MSTQEPKIRLLKKLLFPFLHQSPVIRGFPVVLIMRIYHGTDDNKGNVHALVGGIIHQVGQVAEAIRTALPSSPVHFSHPLTGARDKENNYSACLFKVPQILQTKWSSI